MSDIEVIKDDEIDLLDLVSVLVKNIKWIVGITLTFMIGIVVISIISKVMSVETSFLPDEYSPKSIVMLNSDSGSSGLSSLLGSDMGGLASLAGISGGEGMVTDSAIAMKLITTNSFIEKITTEFDLATVYETYKEDYPKNALKEILTKKLLLVEDEDSGMLEISYTDIDKELATRIVNRATSLLEEEFAKIDKIKNRSQYSIVTEQVETVKADIDRLQSEIIQFQTRNNMLDVNTVSEALVSQITAFQAQLLKKEVEIDSYGKVSSIIDPAYIKLTNERDAIINAINKLENGEVGDFPPVKELPKLSFELNALQQELEVRLTAYKALVTQSESLRLTEEGTGTTFQVLEYAEVPEMKSGPSRGKLSIIVTFAGFFLSIFFVFIKEAWTNIKNDPEKMKKLRGES